MKKYLLFLLFSFSPAFLIAQNFVWAKNFASQSNLDQSNNVDANGNVYTIGSFVDSTDFDPGPATFMLKSTGDLDAFVSKLDPNGNFIWAKKIGGAGIDCGYSLVFDSAGNIYISGVFSSGANFDPGVSNYTLALVGSYANFICKLDVNGNFIWAKGIGGANINARVSLNVDVLGNLYATGGFLGTVDFDPGPGNYNLTAAGWSFDAFVLKLDTIGNFVWAKRFGAGYWDSGTDIALDNSSNVFLTGLFNYTVDFDPGPGVFNISSPDGSNTFILKLDALGNFIWAKSFKGDGFASEQNQGNSIIIDGSGNVCTTGYFTGNIDFDPGPSSYVIAGGSSFDPYISKLDPNGNFMWAKNIRGNDDGYGRAICRDSSGNLYLTGIFRGTADFDPSVATYDLTSAGTEDVFISKLDAFGNFVWAENIGGYDFDKGTAITIAGNGDICVTGTFSNTVDFDPGLGVYNLTATGYNDVFTLKLGNIFSNGIPEFVLSTFQIYPIPSRDVVKIRTHRTSNDTSYNIYDQTGRLILIGNVSGSETSVDIRGLASGLYFITLGNETKPVKLIKE